MLDDHDHKLAPDIQTSVRDFYFIATSISEQHQNKLSWQHMSKSVSKYLRPLLLIKPIKNADSDNLLNSMVLNLF